MLVKIIQVSGFASNSIISGCEKTKECMIVDPGGEPDKIISFIEKNGLIVKIIYITHAHIDHIGGLKEIKDSYRDASITMHAADDEMLKAAKIQGRFFGISINSQPPADRYVEDGDEVIFGRYKMTVIHTPGHSPGGTCLFYSGEKPILISGDTLFCRGVGRTDLWGGDWGTLISSIKNRIFTLPGQTIVLPGHGPQTTVEDEIKGNPFF
jgi:glyoxylase-like metal-dependent hydrolase (beta-lactamase superfamily II)